MKKQNKFFSYEIIRIKQYFYIEVKCLLDNSILALGAYVSLANAMMVQESLMRAGSDAEAGIQKIFKFNQEPDVPVMPF